MRRWDLLALIGLILLASCAVATLTTGATPWDMVWSDLILRLQGRGQAWNPLADERLPRLLVLISTGSALAVAGAVTQALFRNPLASPSVLGVSAGGGLMAMLALAFGWHQTLPFAPAVAGCLGCMGTLLLVYTIARRHHGTDLNTVLLCGIALSSILFAVRGAISYALRDHWQLVQTLTEWEAGSSHDRSWQHVHLQLPLTLIGLAGAWHYRKEINILALGEQEAANMGVDVSRVRWRLFACIAVLTGGALAGMGIVGFLGLVMPHIVRLLVGADNQKVLPLAALGGAVMLVSLDLVLRLFTIRAVSIGNVSAVIGGGYFLVMLFRQVWGKGGQECYG